ncbi:MAG: WYL domain-containing protein, partial [Propionibacteriaceae bacterium]|nr:WYL domain-containing protein [Propionibacteriaceae bacterium]
TQVARLLSLIPYIQDNPGITLHEAARAFQVSVDQVRQDLQVAVFCGLPGGYPGDLIDVDLDVMDDEGLIYLNNPTTLDRPLRLTAAESASLQLALLALRALASPEMTTAIDAVLAKIAGPERPVDLKLSAGDETIRTTLATAITACHRLQLTYDGRARGVTTHPTIDPVNLYVADGVAYLIAYCLDRSDWRTYRLDRISTATPTGATTVAHPNPPTPDTWTTTVLAESATVRLTVRDSAAWIAEYYPTTAVDSTPKGLTIELPVVEPAWLVRLLLGLGDEVLDVDPPSYADLARGLARQTLEAYSQT